MRSAARLWCVVGATLLAPGPAYAQNPDDSLKAYAVNIVRSPDQTSPGYGIYLGKGLVLTAAHVVGRAWEATSRVVIGGKELPAKIIKEGSYESVDLTLLSVEEERLPIWLRMRQEKLCEGKPEPGRPVVVVVPEGVAPSRIMSPALLPADVRARFSTVISDVARTGNSGSGIFDAAKRCLVGIMSRKIQQIRTRKDTGAKETSDIAKYFVPASVIAEFIPAEYKF